ncbi:MAG: NAD-dependent epimerase/dehydratase family protein [Desulfobacteraceae bacterium]|jgi:nucleoside-diphosphate-sugar epimerase
MDNQNRYLITGATGFMGPRLISFLLSKGHFCRCLARDPRKVKQGASQNFEIVCGDITKPETLKGVAADMDYVLHLATLGHMSNYTVAPEMFEDVNVNGTVNIMHEALAANVKRIVHCSSVAVMGICRDNPATEKSQCFPHHPYGKSKLKAEQKVRFLVEKNGLPAVIIRFSMVYGPGDWRDMLKLTRLAQKGLFPKIGGKPKLTPLIHVDDAIQGILLAAEKGKVGETYLITNAQSEPFDQIRIILQKALGVRRFPLYVPEWAALLAATIVEKTFSLVGKTPPVARKNIESTIADRAFSIEKARRELGFNPMIDPVTGLKQTVDWYKSNKWI